jgi:hypothetical protein
LAGGGLARADGIKVMASVALKSTLDDLVAKFENTGGGKVTVVYGTAATGLFQDHPHITVFPGDGIDVMPVVTGPPED